MNVKKIGYITGIATAAGVALGSTAFVSLGSGSGTGGSYFVYAIIIVTLMYLCFAVSACELNDILPGCKGNSGKLLERAFGPAVSIVLNLMTFLIVSIVAGSAETIFVSRMISSTLLQGIPYQVIAVCILLTLAGANLIGVDMFARIQNFVFVFLFGTLLLLAIVGCFGLSPNADIVTDNVPQITGVMGTLELSSWAFYLFVCIDLVLPLACYMRRPKKDMRISLMGGIIMLGVLYCLLSIGLNKYLPLDVLAVDPMPNVTYGTTLLGTPGYYLMTVSVIFAAISTENTLLQSPSAGLLGCANNRLFPKIMTKVNKRNAPYPWIILISISQIIICSFFGDANLDLLIMVSCGFYLVVYILFHVATIKFRILYPNANRDKRFILFYIPQILGILGLLYIEYTIFCDITILIIDLIICVVTLGYAVLWCKVGLKKSPFVANTTEPIELVGQDLLAETATDIPASVTESKPIATGNGNIITISREFGSMGRPIARLVAKKLGYALYDPQLIEEAAKRLDANIEELLTYDDQNAINPRILGSRYCGMAYPLGIGDKLKQRRLFEAQKEIIEEISKTQNAVIVGRAADYILTKADKENLLRIHISAAYEYRLKESIEELNLSENEAKEHIKIIDKAREDFYKDITGEDFNSSAYRDVIINSGYFTKEYVADMICNIAKQKFATE